jgi:hypothetical protein
MPSAASAEAQNTLGGSVPGEARRRPSGYTPIFPTNYKEARGVSDILQSSPINAHAQPAAALFL